MHDEQAHSDAGASSFASGDTDLRRSRISRRQALGRLSAVATAGAAAWAVPEILTAKPAAGATLSAVTTSGGGTSGGGVTTSAGTTGAQGDPGTSGANGADGAAGAGATGVTTAASGPGKSLAFTGLDIKRDAEVGAALIAGGWAMQHWASRLTTPTAAADGGVACADVHQAGSADEPA